MARRVIRQSGKKGGIETEGMYEMEAQQRSVLLRAFHQSALKKV